MSETRTAEKLEPCCAHPKCPGGSICCCQTDEAYEFTDGVMRAVEPTP